MIPYWYEIVVWVWYLGLLLSQITNPGAKGGLSWAKYVLVVLGVFSYIAHGVGIFVDPSWWSFVIYVRNLFYGVSLLVATILILDFLSFHHLFGPWAIIIGILFFKNPFSFPKTYAAATILQIFTMELSKTQNMGFWGYLPDPSLQIQDFLITSQI